MAPELTTVMFVPLPPNVANLLVALPSVMLPPAEKLADPLDRIRLPAPVSLILPVVNNCRFVIFEGAMESLIKILGVLIGLIVTESINVVRSTPGDWPANMLLALLDSG